jgi:hypothetical protein
MEWLTQAVNEIGLFKVAAATLIIGLLIFGLFGKGSGRGNKKDNTPEDKTGGE